MRTLIGTLALLAAMVSIDASASAAHAGAWCARYFGHGGTNCGFYTHEQCRVNVSGIGGFCERNTFEDYPVYEAPRRPRYYR